MDRMQPVSPVRASPMQAPSGANGNGNQASIVAIIAAEHALTVRFPDLQPQLDHPSALRRDYDVLATDSTPRFTFGQMIDLFIEGAGSMDPARDIRADVFDRVVNHLQHVLFKAYACSPTFRRLFNYAADTHLRDTRWVLAAGEAFGTTATEQQREAAGGRSVIALNCDPFDPGGNPGIYVYVSAQGDQTFSGERLYIHEIVRALTGIADSAEAHPRGAVVEYENFIMKEMGEDSPARIAYVSPALPQYDANEGVNVEVDFASVDFGDAFDDPMLHAVRRAAQEARDQTKDRDAPGAA